MTDDQQQRLRWKRCVGCGMEMSRSEPQPCASCRDDDDPREMKPCSMCDGTRELRYHANDPAWETDRRSVEHLRDESNGDHIIQCPNHKAMEAAP